MPDKRVWAMFALLYYSACGPTEVAPSPAHSAESQPSALRVVPNSISPVRASREELLERLRTPLSRSTDDLPREPRIAGGYSLPLRGRVQHAMVAWRDQNGQLQTRCVDSLSGAADTLSHAEPAP